jgi:endonuclease III
MARKRREVLERLLERHGRTFAGQLGIHLDREGEAGLFRLLVASLLMSARISTDIALAAATALFEHGHTTARAMVAATWQDRVDALGEGGYVRYDESTATYLGETAQLLLDRYDGDLDNLRAAADGDPDRIQRLLRECKGIGAVGAAIFCREAQMVWDELQPFADDAALEVARRLGLGDSARQLADAYGDDDLSLLTAALVRARLDDDVEAILTGDAGTPTETQVARMRRDELYELAQEYEIPHRSSMTRDELAEALLEQ